MNIQTIKNILFSIFLILFSFFSRIDSIFSQTKTLTLASDSYNDSFLKIHPLFESDTNDKILKNLLFTPLIEVSKDWKYVCRMCESFPNYSIKKESGKIKTITHWKLKKWYWSDGSEVTSQDVKFSWEVLKAIYNQNKIYHPLEYIESINIKDEKTFDIVFLGTQTDFYKIEGFYLVPSKIEKPIWEESLKKPTSYKKKSMYYNLQESSKLYNGAFYPKTKNQLVANKFNKINLKDSEFFSNVDKIYLLNLRKEDLAYSSQIKSFDIFYSVDPYFNYPSTLPSLGYHFIKNSSSIYENIAFNLQNTLFSSQPFRDALTLAIDKNKISSKLGLNSTDSFINSKDPSFYPQVKKYPFDPKKAESILEELGYHKDPGSSYRLLPNSSEILEISICFLNIEQRRLIVSSIKEDFKKVGIKLNPIPLTQKEYKKLIKKGSFEDLLLLSWQIPIDNPPRGLFYSKEIPTFDSGYSGQNIFGLRSKELDNLFDSYIKEEDQTKKHLIHARISLMISQTNCSIPLFFMDQILYTKKDISFNFYPSFWD